MGGEANVHGSETASLGDALVGCVPSVPKCHSANGTGEAVHRPSSSVAVVHEPEQTAAATTLFFYYSVPLPLPALHHPFHHPPGTWSTFAAV